MTTSVVNVRRDEACDVYIGRPSTFGNPIVVGQACPECLKYHAVPGDTLVCFSRYFWRRVGAEPAFRAKLRGLIGKRLGCYCRPPDGFGGRVMCHGQYIVGYLEGIEPEAVP